MSTHVIVGLGGSLRERSYSLLGLKAALEIAASQGAETVLLDIRNLNLPIYLPDEPIESYPAEYRDLITRLIEACRRSTGMIWASPTYHGTVSGAVKNALDYFELMADDEPAYLTGRAVGLITVSDPVTFGSMMNSVYELRAWLAPTHAALRRDMFDPDGKLINERARRRLTRMVNELMGFGRV